MKKLVIASALLAIAAGCKTVTVKSLPEGARVKCEEVDSTSPAKIETVWLGAKKSVKLSKDGYADKTVPVSFNSPSTLLVQLEKKYNISANVEGATIRVDGADTHKTTPARDVAINPSMDSVVRVSKKGWLDAKLTVKPSTPTDIHLTLEKDGPGRRLLNLKMQQDGILVEVVPIFSDTEVGETSPNVANVRRLTASADNEFIQNISLLPDGKTLVASIIEEYTAKNITRHRANLWKIGTDHNKRRRQQLTTGDFMDITPNASKENNTLYFATTRNGRTGIWSIDMETKRGLKKLTEANTADYLPSLDPTCKQLVYTAVIPSGEHPSYLWTMDADGRSSPSQMTRGYNAVWSPDGTKLLYVDGAMNEGAARIWVMDADGSNPTQLTYASGKHNDIDPRWSPDGKSIVFASNRSIVNGRNNYDIWVMDIDGNNLTQLTTNSSCDDRPVFSPDGKTIYFRSNRGLVWDIWAMDRN